METWGRELRAKLNLQDTSLCMREPRQARSIYERRGPRASSLLARETSRGCVCKLSTKTWGPASTSAQNCALEMHESLCFPSGVGDGRKPAILRWAAQYAGTTQRELAADGNSLWARSMLFPQLPASGSAPLCALGGCPPARLGGPGLPPLPPLPPPPDIQPRRPRKKRALHRRAGPRNGPRRAPRWAS